MFKFKVTNINFLLVKGTIYNNYKTKLSVDKHKMKQLLKYGRVSTWTYKKRVKVIV